MKNCWKVLGIARTADIETVKKTYRELVKKYHPDRARSPEKVRHYTIKCAEINEAYRQALRECAVAGTAGMVGPVPSTRLGSTQHGTPSPNSSSRIGSAIAVVICVVGALGWAEILFDLKVGPLNTASAFFGWFSGWFNSLPKESSTRMILSGLFAVPLGIMLGGVAAMLGPILPPILVVGWLENTTFSRYSFKAAWVLFTIAQYFAVYHAGYHWPFDHRATGYYSLLNDVSRFIGWMYLPLYGLWFWILEYFRYRKVK